MGAAIRAGRRAVLADGIADVTADVIAVGIRAASEVGIRLAEGRLAQLTASDASDQGFSADCMPGPG